MNSLKRILAFIKSEPGVTRTVLKNINKFSNKEVIEEILGKEIIDSAAKLINEPSTNGIDMGSQNKLQLKTSNSGPHKSSESDDHLAHNPSNLMRMPTQPMMSSQTTVRPPTHTLSSHQPNYGSGNMIYTHPASNFSSTQSFNSEYQGPQADQMFAPSYPDTLSPALPHFLTNLVKELVSKETMKYHTNQVAM